MSQNIIRKPGRTNERETGRKTAVETQVGKAEENQENRQTNETHDNQDLNTQPTGRDETQVRTGRGGRELIG